jgi:hypothetical protein
MSSDPSSYIPTTTVAVTRNGDTLNYPMVSNVDGTLGTAYAEPYLFVTQSANAQIIAGLAGSAFWPLGFDGSIPKKLQLYSGPVITTANGTPAKTASKVASAWSGTTGSNCLNGGTVGTGAFTAYPNSGVIGISGISASTLQGSIRNVKFYATRLTDAELQGLTT